MYKSGLTLTTKNIFVAQRSKSCDISTEYNITDNYADSEAFLLKQNYIFICCRGILKKPSSSLNEEPEMCSSKSS